MHEFTKEKYLRQVSIALAGVIFTMPLMAMPEGGPLSGARKLEVVEVKGEALPQVLGQGIEAYSVMSVNGNALAPIPYQFDDLNVKGFVFVPGGKVEIDGKEDVLEAHDELVFMYKDTGTKASAEMLEAISGEMVAEIELNDEGRISYAYVVKGNSERSDLVYAKYDRDVGLIETTMYTLKVDPDNLLIWDDYTYKDFTEARSILDTMKLRVRAKLGPLGATISNKLIPNEIVGVKNAPVRSIVEMDASISILGIQLATAGASVTLTENSLEFPVFLVIPKAAGVLSSIAIEISLDFDQLQGSRIRTALGPKEPIISGGNTGADPANHQVTLQDNWLSLSSGKGWDIIAFFQPGEEFTPQLSFLYKDKEKGDKKDKPERFKGSDPQVGYNAEEIPVGIDSYLAINLYYSNDFWNGNQVEKSVQQLLNPVSVKVNNL